MDNLFKAPSITDSIVGKRCALFSIGRFTADSFSNPLERRKKIILMSRAVKILRTANKKAINNFLSEKNVSLKASHPHCIFIDYDTGFSTMLVFPKEMTEEEVISDLDVNRSNYIPQTIWIALIASMRWIESPIPVRESIGALQDLVYEETVEKTSTLKWTTKNKTEMDSEYASIWISNILSYGEMPSESNDTPPSLIAGMIWIVSRYIWDIGEIPNVVSRLKPPGEYLTSRLGTLFEMISGSPIHFRGTQVQPRIFLEPEYPHKFLDMWFWRMLYQIRALNPSPDTTKHLFPRGIPTLTAEDKLLEISTPINYESVVAILKEGEDKRVYPTPEEGRGYVVEIPFEPIKEVFSECRIWHSKSQTRPDKDVIFCCLDGPYGGVFFALLASEDHLDFIWRENHDAFKVMSTMLVGIWRDLVGEGEEVFSIEEEVEEGEEEPRSPRPYKPSVKNLDRILYLPRAQYVRWGPPKERKYILGRARRGSFIEAKAINLTRSGRKPSTKQKMLAEEYGITLPPGWTFRKEHWRGPRHEEGEEERPKIIKCRGLSTVAYLLGDLLKGE